MLTVNVNYIRCANTMGNTTIDVTSTAINTSCTLYNVTDMPNQKSSCDNQIIYLFIKESHFDVFPHIFEYYPRLQSVDLSKAGVQHIESTTFERATHLTVLMMSESNMKTLQNNWFSYANNLTDFNMANSSIETIEKYAFHGLSNLKNLDLSYNNIRSLDAEIFHPLSRLDHIRLNNNKIAVIDNDIFKFNSQLKWAYFNNNEIIVIEPNSFLNCRLQSLDLGFNLLHDVDLTTIKYLKNLIVSGNDLVTLRVPSVVESLYADNNTISVIQSEANNGLTHLYLSSNHLIDLQQLANFNKLQFLDLSDNHLESIAFPELKALTQLKELKLCGNKLAEINVDEVVTHLPKLKLIELSTKHWSDSYIEKLKSDLNNHTIELGQDRSDITDDNSSIPSTKRPPPVTQATTVNPAFTTVSPNADNVDRKLEEITKKLSDLEYRTGANAVHDSKLIDGRLLDIEDKLMKSNADSDAKYEAMRSTFKVYEALVIIMFISFSIFLLYKVVIYSKAMLNGMHYRRTQSREPIFSEQDL